MRFVSVSSLAFSLALIGAVALIALQSASGDDREAASTPSAETESADTDSADTPPEEEGASGDIAGAAAANGDEANDKEAHDDDAHGGRDDVHGDDPHGGHGAHEDPMHANATDQLESVQEFRPDLAIVTLVIFLLLLAILGKFAWKPITAALDKREHTIAAQIDEAAKNADESRRLMAEHEAKLAAAADEVREMLAQARRDADATKDRIVGEAQEAAARERERAVADIQAAKSAALSEVAQKSADMAFALAGRIVRRELNANDHAQLVREAIEQMPSKN